MNRMPRALAILAFTLLAGASLPAATALAKVYVYNCVLSPKQESPPTASSGAGGGYFVIDTDANQVKYWISFGGLTSPENAAHIHGFAAPGLGGGILTSLPAGNPKIGTWNYTEPQEASILAGLAYANIHTDNFGGGELRGQIVPLNAVLDQAQETPTPPVASTGTGWMTATIDTAANTISYYIAYSGLTGAVNAAHFHGLSNYGAPGGVRVTLAATASPMTGTVSYPAADEAAILSGRYYVNLHTVANSGGEIRGQVSPHVVPADMVQEGLGPGASSGYALTAIDTAANVLGFDLHVTQLSGPETSAHIHGYASLGEDSNLLLAIVVSPRALGTWTYPAANETDVLTGRTYFNVHTGLNSNGEIRGQNLYQLGTQPVAGVDGPPRVLPRLSAAPNPFGSHTSLTFNLPRTSAVSLAILSVDGRRVRNVPPTLFAPGPHSYEWDGLDDAGRAAAPGIYFAVVHTPDGDITTRLARLK